ncbi:MAG: FtsQ-type POTRA domain-containing protein [Nitrospinota bacterium]|nr:FtsQ-type POTRA domain-containing protein [Nitrospinota bacterium]
MDYILNKTRGSRLNWGEVHSRQRKKHKGTGKALKGRQIKNRQREFKNLARTWVDVIAKAALVMVMGYGAFHGYRFVTTAPQFAVADIQFSGNEKVRLDILEGMAQPLLGQNIFQLDLQSVTEQFKQNSWIENVSAVRRLPRGISIEIQERTPFARIQLDKTYLMDHYGVLIKPDDKEYKTLPLITGVKVKRVKLGNEIPVEGIVPGLQAMHFMNQLSAFENDRIQKFHMSSPRKLVFTTENRGIDIYLAVDRIQEGFENLKIILDAMDSNLSGIQYIDLSFKDKVVVKQNRKEPERGKVTRI